MSNTSIRLEEAKRGLNAGGGIPVVREGRIIGAVGASAGSVVQYIAVAEAAIAAIA
ncbi:heme-binding protein [Rhizobium sp. BK251]|uniref:heme-binding protein n=1 Tax=Rhizobium sp. BK251 TaxID=2512125 RepID=UPI001051A696|nr:heme-binding protein [Rhizobium sp. BK251]TCL67171.1 heme-degrading protein [Rhizobium sp. BK251]